MCNVYIFVCFENGSCIHQTVFVFNKDVLHTAVKCIFVGIGTSVNTLTMGWINQYILLDV